MQRRSCDDEVVLASTPQGQSLVRILRFELCPICSCSPRGLYSVSFHSGQLLSYLIALIVHIHAQYYANSPPPNPRFLELTSLWTIPRPWSRPRAPKNYTSFRNLYHRGLGGGGGLVRPGWGAAKGSRPWTMVGRRKESDNKGLGRAIC